MKYRYDFCNEAVEVDVPEEWAQILQEMDREEYNNNQKETRRTSSLEEFDPNDWHMASKEDVEEKVILGIESDKLARAIQELPDRQRFLVELLFLHKRSYAEIARMEGRDESTIRRTAEFAFIRLKKALLKK